MLSDGKELIICLSLSFIDWNLRKPWNNVVSYHYGFFSLVTSVTILTCTEEVLWCLVEIFNTQPSSFFYSFAGPEKDGGLHRVFSYQLLLGLFILNNWRRLNISFFLQITKFYYFQFATPPRKISAHAPAPRSLILRPFSAEPRAVRIWNCLWTRCNLYI